MRPRRFGQIDFEEGFNSRTPGGVRQHDSVLVISASGFQFTHPGRGATGQSTPCRQNEPSFNSRTPGGVRHARTESLPGETLVSIHAPREGCDEVIIHLLISKETVSIHAPREGCDGQWRRACTALSSFNSRTPGGVRLYSLAPCDVRYRFQFTHPGRGATSANAAALQRMRVSIHAPREGCDRLGEIFCTEEFSFNSRTPGGVRLDERKQDAS